MKKSIRNAWSFAIAGCGLLMLLGACQPVQRLPADQGATAPASPSNAASSEEAANKAVVQRFYDEVFTQKQMPVLEEVFAPNLVIHDLDVGGELPGGGLPETLAAFPDVKATVNALVVEGDLVAASVSYTGTHQAEFLGVAPTGRTVTWSLIDLWRVQDGKIIELWHNIPNDDILEQIGPEVGAAAPYAVPTAETAAAAIAMIDTNPARPDDAT